MKEDLVKIEEANQRVCRLVGLVNYNLWEEISKNYLRQIFCHISQTGNLPSDRIFEAEAMFPFLTNQENAAIAPLIAGGASEESAVFALDQDQPGSFRERLIQWLKDEDVKNKASAMKCAQDIKSKFIAALQSQ